MMPHRSMPLIGCLAVACGCGVGRDAPPDYRAIFVRERLVRWSIRIDDDAWQALQIRPAVYVAAQLTVDGVSYRSVGVRLTGTRRGPKRNLRLRFNRFDESQRFFGVKRVNLRGNWGDPSLIREVAALRLFARAGVPAPRAALVWVELNGRGGVYTLVEQVDRRFLERSFADKEGVLYKVERGGDLLYRGEEPAAYPEAVYELKTDDLPRGHRRQDLIALTRALANASGHALADSLEHRIDIDGLLRALAVNTWLSNMNAYPGSADNFYLYADRDRRFHYIPWNLTQAFGDYHGEACGLSTDALIELDPDRPTCGGDRPLVDRVLEQPRFEQRYHDHLRQLTATGGPLAPGRASRELRELHQLAAVRAAQDREKDVSDVDFAAALTRDLPSSGPPARPPGLEPFIARRDRRIQQALEQ